MKSKVYFSRKITGDEIVKLYNKLGVSLDGEVAVKLHSGELGNQNFLGPKLFKKIIFTLNIFTDNIKIESTSVFLGRQKPFIKLVVSA